MDSIKLIWQSSPWYMLLCLLGAFTISFVLYYPRGNWTRNIQILLASIRFVVVFVLLFLLVAPLLKLIKEYFEKPIIVLAIDNSQSIANARDTNYIFQTKKDIAALANKLQKLPIDLQIRDFDGQADLQNVKYNVQKTNLSQLFANVQSDYANKNLQGIIVPSDGIYNQGLDPSYNPPAIKLYTIGLGDTIPQKDVAIQNVFYNKVSFINNKFPLRIDVNQYGYASKKVKVNIKQNNKLVDSKILDLRSNNEVQEVDFLLDAKEKGLQHYVVEVEKQASEINYTNNIYHVYIDVLDNQERILIVANAPNPDIRAISEAIKSKEQYQLDLYIPDIYPYKEAIYDLIIYYQVPTVSSIIPNQILEKLQKTNTSSIYIVGNTTNFSLFNNINKHLNIAARFGQVDNVTAAVNPNFLKFKLETEELKQLNAYPPVMVPFGNFTFAQDENSQVILYQKIGSTTSSKPLFYFHQSDNVKTGYILCEGLWQWRINEKLETTEAKTFDKLITSFVQLVSNKEDKRKFRFYPIKNEYYTSESIYFNCDVYNDIYENIYNQTISLKLTDEQKKVYPYTFVNSEANSKMEVKGLSEGIYKYEATTTIAGKVESSKGEFIVKTFNLEAMNSTANHQLLQKLATSTNGLFVTQNNINSLTQHLESQTFKSMQHSTEELEELINLKWIFFLLMILISTEWFTRKYKGSY